MKGFVIAVQFLTRLPTPGVQSDEDAFARSMRWFPAVGLLIGAMIGGAGWIGGHIDSWTGALAALLVWVGITGALHLDGLSDLADAGGAAHKDREKLLAVLADPHVGSFGVVAVGVQLIAKLVLLHGLVEASLFPAIAVVPFAARLGPLVWTRWLPSLHDGLAARFRSAIRPLDIALWSVALLAMAMLAPALLATPLLVAGWAWWVKRTLGGISGDAHGAGIELTETSLLAAVLIVGRLL